MKAISFYDLGFEAGFDKPNEENCNFAIFSTPETRDEWQKGYEAGKEKKKV